MEAELREIEESLGDAFVWLPRRRRDTRPCACACAPLEPD